MSGIDCRQAETLVARYIKHTLSTDELEEFLDHIEHCSSCMMSWRHILSFMRQFSSWMRRKMVRSLIFGNFWNRISVDHADISARKMAAFFVCDFFMAVSDRGCIICCISCNGSNALFIT